MNQREKILAATVGGFVVILGLFWGFSQISSKFDTRNDEIARLTQEIANKEGTVRRGNVATSQLKNWEKRSLSSDVSRATTQYRVWLYDLTQKTNLNAEIRPTGARPQGEIYVQHTFQVTGEAELPRLIQFMHQFYNAGYLHRIATMTTRPVPDKKALDLSMTIEVLSLNKASKDAGAVPPTLEEPLPKTSEQYAKAILERNFFYPENQAPKISSLGVQRGNPNRTLSFTVKATDPDKQDRLTYALESSSLEGARIDPKTGEFRWTPTKLGDNYEAIVRVTDDGIPAKSAIERIKIAVAEAPPPPKENPFLKDDPARDARISGTTGSGDNFQVWVTVPRGLGDQPKTLHLKPGDPISVGSFVGVVKAVRSREAEFELKDGRTVVVRFKEPLVGDRL